MKEEHDRFFSQKIPEVERLKVDFRVKKPPEAAEVVRQQAPRAVDGV